MGPAGRELSVPPGFSFASPMIRPLGLESFWPWLPKHPVQDRASRRQAAGTPATSHLGKMEVALLKHNNLPEDAILSIRAGTVRRQAACNSGRPFRFPKSAEEAAVPLKIDILKQVGSAYLVLKPGTDQYKVLFPKDPAGMELEVKVMKLDGAAAVAAGADKEVEDPKDAANGAKAAKDYLEQHQVLQFVQGVLQTVIKEKPEDPFGYMARHFMGGYDASAPPPPPPPAVPAPAEKAQSAEAPAPAAEEVKPEVAPVAPAEAKPAEAPAPSAEEAKPAEAPAPAAEEAPAPAAEEAKPVETPAPAAEEAKPAESPAPAAEEAKPAEAPAPAAEEAKPAEAPAPAAEEAKPAEAPAPITEEAKPAKAAAPEAKEAKPAEAPAPAAEEAKPA
ncbi:unnamed protein product [Prorocentrum cordatum]|uniref:Uncharacterized protein n=1 Tax=Prorocentrum cordatum TaxID=2364126 RepID=A0ABN9XM74_9DINO|nr:unnamed protein product [Polarella glacialis]